VNVALIIELRLLCCDEVALIEQRTAFINQLRHAVAEYYPTALEAFEDWDRLVHGRLCNASLYPRLDAVILLDWCGLPTLRDRTPFRPHRSPKRCDSALYRRASVPAHR
jgi:hypothetical protein